MGVLSSCCRPHSSEHPEYINSALSTVVPYVTISIPHMRKPRHRELVSQFTSGFQSRQLNPYDKPLESMAFLMVERKIKGVQIWTTEPGAPWCYWTVVSICPSSHRPGTLPCLSAGNEPALRKHGRPASDILSASHQRYPG